MDDENTRVDGVGPGGLVIRWVKRDRFKDALVFFTNNNSVLACRGRLGESALFSGKCTQEVSFVVSSLTSSRERSVM